MRLRTPICSMKAITFCCAPAPMESMATTAATPKIIPSMVSRERSLWLARFSKPKARSGIHCASDLGSARERVFIVRETASFGARAHRRTRTFFLGLFGATRFRIDQRHHGPRLDALNDCASFAERAELNFLLLETAVAFAIDDLLAFAIENGFAGDGYGVRKLLTANGQACRKARAEARIGLVEKNRHVEFMLRVVVPECMGCGAPYGFHLACELVVGQWVDLNVYRLTRFEVAVIGFSHLCIDFQMRHINDFSNGAARIHLIAYVIIRKSLAEEHAARGIEVGMDNHQTVNRGDDGHVLDILFGLIHGQARLVAFFLADGQGSFVGGAVRADVLLELCQGALGFLQRKVIFLRVDFAYEFVLADFQLSLADLVLGF